MKAKKPWRGKRQIVLYSNDAEAPSDLAVGEVVPLIRGDGPREGDLMGMATITRKDDELEFTVESAEAS